MVSPSVAADENWKVAESRFCSPGDHLSTFNNFWDASKQTSGCKSPRRREEPWEWEATRCSQNHATHEERCVAIAEKPYGIILRFANHRERDQAAEKAACEVKHGTHDQRTDDDAERFQGSRHSRITGRFSGDARKINHFKNDSSRPPLEPLVIAKLLA